LSNPVRFPIVVALALGAAEAQTPIYDAPAPILAGRCVVCHSGPSAAAERNRGR
jgi:hypothetical protein